MSKSRVKWPIVVQQAENQEHIRHLKSEAQQLIATLKGPTPEKKNTKRGLPHKQAVQVLKSWLNWVQKERKDIWRSGTGSYPAARETARGPPYRRICKSHTQRKKLGRSRKWCNTSVKTRQ